MASGAQFLIPDEAGERHFIEGSAATGVVHRHGAQLQLALVPNDDVELVAGSHVRWDSAEEYLVRCADDRAHSKDAMPGAVRVALQAGDALVFNQWGFHRGRYHAEIPRRTLHCNYSSVDFPT